MREIWDAAAASGSDVAIGRPDAAQEQLERLFAQLDAEPSGHGTCLEIGCGAGRMTAELVGRWPHVIASDVSPAMIERARSRVPGAGVTFVLTEGALEGVADASIDVAVCFGVLQHLPTRAAFTALLADLERVLVPGGEAFVQLPVLHGDARARAWRLVRSARTRRGRGSGFEWAPEYRGTRLTRSELDRVLEAAKLQVVAAMHDDDPTLYSTYPHADDVRLRLSSLRARAAA
jgi:SAM-dependent methyltransferase